MHRHTLTREFLLRAPMIREPARWLIQSGLAIWMAFAIVATALVVNGCAETGSLSSSGAEDEKTAADDKGSGEGAEATAGDRTDPMGGGMNAGSEAAGAEGSEGAESPVEGTEEDGSGTGHASPPRPTSTEPGGSGNGGQAGAPEGGESLVEGAEEAFEGDEGGEDSGETDEPEPTDCTENPDDPACPDPVVPECVDNGATTLFMSADDSNSQASPVIARSMIKSGWGVPYGIRTYEFLNYYTFDYPDAAPGTLAIYPELTPIEGAPGSYAMQIGVRSSAQDTRQGVPLTLTFVVDTSGSMAGAPVEREKAVLRAIASQLRVGDIVSMTNWNTESVIMLSGYEVTGPDDEKLLKTIGQINADGGTDLHSGLVKGYELARQHFSRSRLNRVVLISDGMANTGITDQKIIGEAAEDSEGEGIYLIGVGTGDGFNDTLMDTVTDLGKGAYVYIDSEEEAQKMFTGKRFAQNLQVAALDVRLSMTLPGTYAVTKFYGEQISTVKELVTPQHLAPGDAMIYSEVIATCDPERDLAKDVIELKVEWRDPADGTAREAVTAVSIENMLKVTSPTLTKGRALIAYTETLKLTRGNSAAAKEACDAAQKEIATAEKALADPELAEVFDVLYAACLPVSEESGWDEGAE